MQQKVLGPQKFRQLADECPYLAQIATNQSLKAGYLRLAKTYDSLADQAAAKHSSAGDERISPED